MTLVAFSSARSGSQQDLLPFERLAINLSTWCSRLEAEDVDEVVARAVEEVGTAFGADECTLIAFGERGATKVVRSWAASPQTPASDEDIANMPWLIRRLVRNTVVSMTPSTDIPLAAAARDRAHAERTGIASRLAVPVAVGTRVAYGLLIGSRERHQEWPTPVVDRLRLVGEILGCGLERARQDEAARASLADGERATPSPDAVYLQEEARNQCEADQIIGESGA